MGKSSGSPKKPEATAEEKALAQRGVESYNRYIDRYAPLEDDVIAASDRPTVNLRAGRANADLMQEASKEAGSLLTSAPVGQGVTALGKLNAALSSAGSTGRGEAIVGDRTYRDQRTLEAIKTGLGQAGNSTSALAGLASQAGANALSKYNAKVQSDLRSDSANNQLLTSIAGGTADMYMRGRQNTALTEKLGRTINANRTANASGLYRNVDSIARLH